MKGNRALCLCGKTGYPVYGVLLPDEAAPIKKRFEQQIQNKILEIEREIRKHLSG